MRAIGVGTTVAGVHPPLRLPDLRTMELLVAISAEGSIGGAARRMQISQQAASQRVRAFEKSLGLTLLARGTRGSLLTGQGRAVAEWAAGLVDTAHAVETAIEALRQEQTLSLRVASSMTIAEHLLPTWLVEFRRTQDANPALSTSVSLRALNSEQVTEQVSRGEVDLGFVEGSAPPDQVSHVDVRTDELVLVVAPDDPLARRRSIRAAQLAAIALTAREPGSGTRAVLEDALADRGLRAAPAAIELGTTTAIRETVRAGGAPAVLSRLAVRADLHAGHLVAVPVSGIDLTRTLRALWLGTGQPSSSAARALLDIACRRRASGPGDRHG
ncbi:LysR family transcriptional regulator [Nocardioides sp. AX2bis]|uniref:LysR family transcriptional regulator n=1 Tax=Nocardioides sp. AX2bis TaxID=2653157 RepID=UPI001F45EA2D|nr:LysR family transcriptional regulator [Nocardioides sp. AX2bis]